MGFTLYLVFSQWWTYLLWKVTQNSYKLFRFVFFYFHLAFIPHNKNLAVLFLSVEENVHFSIATQTLLLIPPRCLSTILSFLSTFHFPSASCTRIRINLLRFNPLPKLNFISRHCWKLKAGVKPSGSERERTRERARLVNLSCNSMNFPILH